MSEVTLRQLEYFAAVAETRSVTEAAKLCHVSQGAVSLSLGQLEHALEVTLAIRQPGRGIFLTPEGQEVATRARLITEHIHGLRTAVSAAHNELAGRLSIGVFTTVALHIVPHLAEWFCHRHPNVELSFVEGTGPEIQEALTTGRTQLSVGYEALVGAANERHLLHEFRRQVVLSPSHPLAEFESISFDQLAGYPAALLNLEPALQNTLAEFSRRDVTPDIRWLFGNVPSIHAVVGRGLAYSLLMQPVSASVEGLPVVFRQISDETPTNSLVAATPPRVARSAMVDEALAALRAQWSEPPAATE